MPEIEPFSLVLADNIERGAQKIRQTGQKCYFFVIRELR